MKRLKAASSLSAPAAKLAKALRLGFATSVAAGMQTLALAADATVSGPGAAAAVAAPATPSATTVAANSSMPSPTGSVFTMMLGLIAVLAIMAAIAWLFKRAGLTQGLSGNSAAKIIGGVSVGTRERVMVIEVADQWIVVGVAPGRVNALATMPRQEHAAPANTPVGAGFSSWLKQTMDKRNQGHQGNSSGSNS